MAANTLKQIRDLNPGQFVLADSDGEPDRSILFVKTVTDDLINTNDGTFFYGRDPKNPRSVKDLYVFEIDSLGIEIKRERHKRDMSEIKGRWIEELRMNYSFQKSHLCVVDPNTHGYRYYHPFGALFLSLGATFSNSGTKVNGLTVFDCSYEEYEFTTVYDLPMHVFEELGFDYAAMSAFRHQFTDRTFSIGDVIEFIEENL